MQTINSFSMSQDSKDAAKCFQCLAHVSLEKYTFLRIETLRISGGTLDGFSDESIHTKLKRQIYFKP